MTFKEHRSFLISCNFSYHQTKLELVSYLDKEGNEAVRHYWDTMDQYDIELANNINWTSPAMSQIKNMTYQVTVNKPIVFKRMHRYYMYRINVL